MATFVLVHGGFTGGWVWKPVRAYLESKKHRVYTPTLTGLGERCHLISPILDLDTHIQDIANVIQYEDLSDVILVGNSYSGMVITGVADKMPSRIAQVIYVDAFLPEHGESVFDLVTPSLRSQFVAQANTQGDGWRVYPLSDGDPRRLAMPIKTLQQPINLSGADQSGIARTFIRCTDPRSPSLDSTDSRVRNNSDWTYLELETSGRAPSQAPKRLSDLLIQTVQPGA
ncbi:MAG: alpha/beta hydrolase [Sphaerobacteraceae bacterium]|nr:MAG: alpha/beta hydrolase [Sphaerobacteraceae bacterium]